MDAQTIRELGYRRLTHLNFRRWEECETLIDWLAAGAGERVLDVGCGDGWWDHRITASGCHVTGIDINLRRLAIAEVRNRTPHTEFHFMDAEHMAFPDASFDRGISMCVIEHFAHDDLVLRELHRVLKPGAPLILSADSLSNPELTAPEREAHRRRFAVNNFYTPAILRDKLDQAGFDLEHTRYILTTPVTLALARLSWRIDDLEESRQPLLARLGYLASLAMDTTGKLISDLSERVARRQDTGLTLLARARRRA